MHLGISSWRHKWRRRAWLKSVQSATPIDNVDLWLKLDSKLQQLPKDHVITEWVKGHGLPHHVKEEMATDLNIWGNSAADGLADKAARAAHKGSDLVRWPHESDDLRRVTDPYG